VALEVGLPSTHSSARNRSGGPDGRGANGAGANRDQGRTGGARGAQGRTAARAGPTGYARTGPNRPWAAPEGHDRGLGPSSGDLDTVFPVRKRYRGRRVLLHRLFQCRFRKVSMITRRRSRRVSALALVVAVLAGPTRPASRRWAT
jgi:hypothetical protein